MKLKVASAVTLGLLSTFLVVAILGIMLYVGHVNLPLAIVGVVIVNLVVWLVSPQLSDFTYNWLYDMSWVTLDEIEKKSPESARVIREVTAEYGYDTPKLGIIHDGNPNAFTYGSDRWNARIIMTEGCFEYLDDNEIAAVMAHELGHITNRDFIIMTIANTLVQLLYIVAIYARRMSTRIDDKRAKSGLAGVAVLTYIFYFISQYLLLYLSRVREYKADNFAAEYTDPDHLSSALLRIAYGIAMTDDDPELAKQTKHIGIMDVDECEDDGLIYYQSNELEKIEPIGKSFLFDLKNPWARVKEFSSTHPLTGKRIKNLCEQSADPMIDFEYIEREYPVDTSRMWREFLQDIAVVGLPMFVAVAYPVGYFAGTILAPDLLFDLGLFLGTWAVVLAGAMLARAVYKYPRGEAEDTTVLDLLADPYASPVRGKNIKLEGQVIGRGAAGYKFGSDLMLKDDTGFMYLRYDHWLGRIGSAIFGWRRVPDLVKGTQTVTMDGWYYRSVSPWSVIQRLETVDDSIKGYSHYSAYLSAVFVLLLGAGAFIFL